MNNPVDEWMLRFNIVAGIASILSLIYAFVQMSQLKKMVRVHYLEDLLRIESGIERNKGRYKDSNQERYNELLDIQSEVTTLRVKLSKQFGE